MEKKNTYLGARDKRVSRPHRRRCCPSCCCCVAWWGYMCLLPCCCRGPMVVVRHMAQTMLADASFGPVFVIAAQFNPPSPYKTYVEPIYTLKTLVSMK